MTELVESGSQFFVDYLMGKGDINSVKDKFKMVGDWVLKGQKFTEKINYALHFLFSNLKSNDEKLIIKNVSLEACHMIDKVQRVNLWIKENMNNELWTYYADKRISFECTTDIIGFCQTMGNIVIVQKAMESEWWNPAFDEVFQNLDPYSHKDRTFVIALPVKHQRSGQLLGVLEICLSRQAGLDDYFMADCLAQISGLILGRFSESRT